MPECLGYFSVVRIEGLGYCGGYLLLNFDGRPLEFHCTMPVNPDRAQQILYGDSLESFLMGELIPRPLLAKSALQPPLILVGDARLLASQQWTASVVVLLADSPRSSQPNPEASDPGRSIAQHVVEKDSHTGWLRDLQQRMDLNEPFDRIDMAIREAHRVQAA